MAPAHHRARARRNARAFDRRPCATSGLQRDCRDTEAIMSEHKGRCFCGAVELTLTGAPAAMGYCHCNSCRHWSAGPINAFTLWKPDAVKVTKGKDNLGTYNKTEHSFRKWCKTCGGHVLTEHPGMGLTDVYAAVI